MLNNTNISQYDKEKNFFEIFFTCLNEEFKEMRHANLIIAGKTGVGKSTLINAAFRKNLAETGIGRPVTNESNAKWYEEEGFPLRILDTIGLELNDEKRKKSIEMINNACTDAKGSNDPDKYIHAMWYCVNATSDRLEPEEADFINGVAEEVDVILVLTKAFRKRQAEKFRDAIEEAYPTLKVRQKVIVLAKDEEPDVCEEGCTPKKAFGVDTLIEVTAQLLPEATQKAWCNAQKANMELKVSKAHAIVIATATAAFGEGFSPLPFSDALALVPTQLGMLAGITSVFGIDISKNMMKTIITSLAGETGATFAGKAIVTGLLKCIPGVGTLVGGAISGTTASVLTVALGEAYIAIMKMIASGEIKEADIGDKKVMEKMRLVYKENISNAKSSSAKGLPFTLKNKK